MYGEILHSYDEIMYVWFPHMLKCLIMNNLVLLESTSDARALKIFYKFRLHMYTIMQCIHNINPPKTAFKLLKRGRTCLQDKNW